jgi:hypothetical protein
MYKFLAKNGQLLAFGLGVLVIAIFLIFVFSGVDQFNMMTKEEKFQTSIFNFGLGSAVALAIIAFIIAIIAGIIHTILNPKGSIKGIVSVVALFVVFLIVFAISSPSETGSLAETIQEFEVSDGASKFITAAITTTLVLLGVAILGLVASGIRNLIKL